MRDRLTVDLVSLAAGAVVAVIGALVLLDSSGAVDLTIGWIAVALTGGLGAIILVSGLAGNAGHGHASSGVSVRGTAAAKRQSY